MRRSSDHAAEIGCHADHLEPLPDTGGGGFAIAAKYASGDGIFLCNGFYTFQSLHEFGFGSVATGGQAKLSMEIVWSDKCYIYAWHRENFIEILERLHAFNLNCYDNGIVRGLCVTRPIGDAESIRAERTADTSSTNRRIF